MFESLHNYCVSIGLEWPEVLVASNRVTFHRDSCMLFGFHWSGDVKSRRIGVNKVKVRDSLFKLSSSELYDWG